MVDINDVGPSRLFSQSVEDYVKAIYKLQAEGRSATTSDLARKLGASAAAASKMIKHLSSLRLAEHTKYHGVRLTPTGEKVALEIIRHHRLLELYLHQALGYGWDEVDAEAEKLEHHISEDFEDRIDALLDYPATDPHGEPIPSRDGTMSAPKGVPLTTFEQGEHVVIRRVDDENPEMLRYLSKLGMTLHVGVELIEKQPFNGPLSIRVGGQVHSIGRELASAVFAEYADEPQGAVA